MSQSTERVLLRLCALSLIACLLLCLYSPAKVHAASVALTNYGLLGFVALRGGQVAMLDLIDRRLVFTVSVGGTPHFVIAGLYPPSTDLIPPAPVPQQGPNVLLIIFLALLTVVLALLALLGFQPRQMRRQPPRRY
jgi:hypothetical protein